MPFPGPGVAPVIGASAARTLSRGETAWCGTGETPDNRLPQTDALSPSTIRVFYAYPTDAPDRFAAVADSITADVAAVDAWWRAQDPARELRWDLYPFPGCEPGIASLDLGVVPLARESAHYAGTTGFERLANEITGRLAPMEKALVFFDGTVIDPRICGVSKVAPRNGGRYGISIVALLSECRVDLGAGTATARIAVHELVHNLGAVPDDAPGRCGDSSLGGHTCDSPSDLMFPYASSDMRLADAILDVARDDYYGHSGTWWDVQDSAWLVHLPRRTLSVSTAGPGAISSAPAVVTCPATCAATLEDGFAVRLAAAPQPGAEFYGWKGACAGEGACALTMTGDLSVRATFGPPRPTLAVRTTGKGRVTSAPAGISCPGRCTAKVPRGTAVTLRAQPAPGWRLVRWSTPCGAKASCVLRITGDRRVAATFAQARK